MFSVGLFRGGRGTSWPGAHFRAILPSESLRPSSLHSKSLKVPNIFKSLKVPNYLNTVYNIYNNNLWITTTTTVATTFKKVIYQGCLFDYILYKK